MPFGGDPLPPPRPEPGITPSAPLNVGLGATVAAGSNMLTTSQFGPEVAGVAFVVNLGTQFVKQFSWLDQHRWWPVLLLGFGVGAFLLLTGGDWGQALPKGGAAAMQAALNYAGQKAAGLNILEAARVYPGSKEV